MFVFQFDNDNYRDRYRLSTFSAVIVPKRFEFRYPTLVVIKKIENPMTSCNRINRCDCWTVGLSMPNMCADTFGRQQVSNSTIRYTYTLIPGTYYHLSWFMPKYYRTKYFIPYYYINTRYVYIVSWPRTALWRWDNVVLLVFTLNRSFYPTTTAVPSWFFILERDTNSVVTDRDRENQKSPKNQGRQIKC